MILDIGFDFDSDNCNCMNDIPDISNRPLTLDQVLNWIDLVEITHNKEQNSSSGGDK